MENYLEINKNSWNAKVEPHLKSDFYFVDEFLNGRTSLNSIELELLGDISNKEILHLQCHFGQDSISLARLGAKVTGIDLSDKAIERAGQLAGEGCIVVKMARPKQDMRLDIPVLGINTLKKIKEINGKGIIVQAKKMIFLEKDEVIKFANENNLFIKGVK